MDKMSQLRDMGARIRARREEMGMSQEMLAEKVGYKSRSSINKIELGKNDIVQSTIKKIADALSTTPAYLMGWEDEKDTTEDTPLPPGLLPLPTMKRIPRLGRIACGQPIMAEENFDGYDDIPESIHADFSLICSGDSMINARIHDGDIVYIRLQEQVENGEIAAVYVDGETTLKRVYLSPGKLVLQAENPKYAPLVYAGQELENIRIIGKAVGFTSLI